MRVTHLYLRASFISHGVRLTGGENDMSSREITLAVKFIVAVVLLVLGIRNACAIAYNAQSPIGTATGVLLFLISCAPAMILLSVSYAG